MAHGTNGDPNIISTYNQWLLDGIEDLEGCVLNLLLNYSKGGYEAVARKFMQKFISGEGGFYEDTDISELLIETNEVKNKVEAFRLNFNERLQEAQGDRNVITNVQLDRSFRFILGARQGYLREGPTILINDMVEIKYYLQALDVKPTGEWEGIFYVEALDHFGLDNPDPNHDIHLFIVPIFDFDVSTPIYQHLDHGFACWWTLQHQQDYVPFQTKIKFIVCLKGRIDL